MDIDRENTNIQATISIRVKTDTAYTYCIGDLYHQYGFLALPYGDDV